MLTKADKGRGAMQVNKNNGLAQATVKGALPFHCANNLHGTSRVTTNVGTKEIIV